MATLCHLANISLRTGRKVNWDAGSQSVLGDAAVTALLQRAYRSPWDRELTALGVE